MIFRRKNKVYTDSELMQQIVSDDQVAFSELYLRYKDRMYYYFYRMLNNSADQANDFLQELFMKLIEKPESYKPAYPFATWLYSVANNMCKNEYRKRGIRQDRRRAQRHQRQQERCDVSAEQVELGHGLLVTGGRSGRSGRIADPAAVRFGWPCGLSKPGFPTRPAKLFSASASGLRVVRP